MRRSPLLSLTLGMALLFSLAACDSNGDDDGNGNGNGNGDQGSFSATLSGDLSGSLSGNAFFSVVDDPDAPSGQAFSLFLTEGNLMDIGNTGDYIGFLRFGDRPGTGEYTISTDPEGGDVAGVYVDFSNQTARAIVSAEVGTLTVTTSETGRLAGTFSFSGQGFNTSDPQNPQEIEGEVEGSFNAVFIDPGDAPDPGNF